MTNQYQTADKRVVNQTLHYEPPLPNAARGGIKRTAAYCRVSTLQEEQELSFETQRDYYLNKIEKAPDMILAGIYADQGFSGLQSKDRREFQRMMRDCEAGKIDLILVKSLSRFSRNAAECIGYLQRLKELGIAVAFEKEGLNSFDREAELLLLIYASIAQNESCVLSQSVCWAKRHSAELGRPAQKTCYGYRIDKSNGGDKTWRICEPEAQRIRFMFDLASKACTFSEIIRALNDYEVSCGGEPDWTYGRVSAALRREAYRGDLLTNKTVVLDYASKRPVKNTGIIDQFYIEGHHEPIVDAEVYEKVQTYLKANLLSGRHKRQRRRWFEFERNKTEHKEEINLSGEVEKHDQEQQPCL